MGKLLEFLNKRFYLVMLGAVVISVLLSYLMPPTVLSGLYGLSLFLKELIVALMPLLIFCCAFQCMYKLRGRGVYLIVFVLGIIALSNFCSSWIGYTISRLFQLQHTFSPLVLDTPKLMASWEISIPKLIPNEMALLVGMFLGLVGGKFLEKPKEILAIWTQKISGFLMQRILAPIIPLFMMGFMIKMMVEGTIVVIFQQYTKLTLIILLTYCSYLLLGYSCMAGFRIKRLAQYLKNMLPAAWVGFSCMSSLAALPLNLQGSAKNTENKEIVEGVLPISTNIHLVGDSIGIPILAMSILLLFYGHIPTVSEYSYFAMMLVLAKFSVAAVPGGGIMVMLPILQSVFGFNGEMAALITMLYILLDPIITTTNVFGNGLLVILIDKIAVNFLPKLSYAKASLNGSP
ncbi:MAG TPA: cation:dicarboxylase symporter family transporter [Gammaproteobacteria bacterium]|nr:cation:dicarboxylase symporter family transporter [Gammaproteobacteria bacterium]